jgi:hypothetical protein
MASALEPNPFSQKIRGKISGRVTIPRDNKYRERVQSWTEWTLGLWGLFQQTLILSINLHPLHLPVCKLGAHGIDEGLGTL